MKEKNNAYDALFSVSKSTSIIHEHTLLALCILLFSYLVSLFTRPLHMGLIEAILMFSFIIICTFYMKHQYPLKRKHYSLALFAILCCIPTALYHNPFLNFLNMLFTFALMGYFLQSASHSQIDETHQQYLLVDVINALFIIPLRTYRIALLSIFSQIHLRYMKGITLGILLSLPLLMIILPLLSSADAAFQNILRSIFPDIDAIFLQLFHILVAVGIFCYIYPLLYAHLYCEKKDICLCTKEKLTQVIQGFAKCPASILITVETTTIVVYAIFLVVSIFDILHSLSMSYQIFSFSEFARRGFFELCLIACINASILMTIQLFTKEKATSVYKWSKRILCIETIFLILTAMSKMYIYIYFYGLTILRVYSSWFMIVLLGCFLLTLFHTFYKQERLLPHIVKYFCISFFVLNLLNTPLLVDRYNQHMPIEIQNDAELYGS